jgi:phage gpG-like protein
MADKSLPIEEFITLIRNEKDDIQKRILQISFEVATEIRKAAIKNANEKFGPKKKDQKSKFPWVARTAGHGLAQSITLSMVGRNPNVSVNVPYATIQEFGGVVRPKNKFLTIPAAPETINKSAKEFGDRLMFGLAETPEGRRMWALSFVDSLVGRGKNVKPKVAFWLVRSVTIPPRPYLSPAIDYVIGNSEVLERVVKKTEKGTLGYEVKVK